MVTDALWALWAEPRPLHPPAPAGRDRALAAVLVLWSAADAMLRPDLRWRPVVLAVGVVVALSVLWRRTRPLAAVTVAFGTLAAVDIARVLAANENGLPWSVSATLLLPYALFRWGAGREAAIGIGPILAWLALTNVADPTGAAAVGAYGFFLFSAALGASIRYYANARIRDIEQAKLRQRSQLARELHDTIGHHVSAIAIQAQAGRALAASDPDRALTTLATIEEAASQTLDELRYVVGVLRDQTTPYPAPQPGVADIGQLARSGGARPGVNVRLSGDVDGLNPSVGGAIYRIAQEAVTNAMRHARNATQVAVDVADEGDRVHLTVSDDGDASAPGAAVYPTRGYGLVGMAERASLLGGTFTAGPGPGGGWRVDAVLPRSGATR